MKKLFAVMLCLLLATGAAYAYDTKIIDEGTDLNNIHQSIRPIAHYGVHDHLGAVPVEDEEDVWIWSYNSVYRPGVRHSPRAIGLGYTVEDVYTNFFEEGLRVGVAGASAGGYYNDKQLVLGQDGGKELDMQQAESRAVYRAIPMMTGTLMGICGKFELPVGQAWINVDPYPYPFDPSYLNPDNPDEAEYTAYPSVPARINPWPYFGYDKAYYHKKEGYILRGRDADGKSGYDFWGVYDRTPDFRPAHSELYGGTEYIFHPRYGYAVPRIEARNIAHALYGNPGTNVGTDDDPFTIGQETMTSVFVWSADKDSYAKKDMTGLSSGKSSSNADTVAVMVRLDNDLYKGMKVSDLNVIKVEAKDGAWQGEFTRVDSASQLRKNTFAVVHRSDKNDRDVVVGGDHIIQAGDRAVSATGGICPPTDTCDLEWKEMQYFVLLAVQKKDPWDVADARDGFPEVVGGLHIIVAERPFVKTPNLCCSYPVGTEPRFGWVLGNRPNAEQRHDGFTRDPFLADAISGRPANMGLDSGYTDAFIENK